MIDEMKKLRMITVIFLLGVLTVQADPFKSWSWTEPTTYENGNPIPGGDLTAFTLHCSNNSGPPYEASQVFDMQIPPSLEDMAFIVGGLPGTYHCVATVSSVAYLSTSGFSNELLFTVAPGVLGYVPNPPVLTLQ